MRIAVFHTTLPQAGRKPGGVDVTVHRLADALCDASRDEVEVWSCQPAPPGHRYRARQIGRPAARLLTTKVGRWVAVPLLLNAVDARGVDVLHLHGDDWFFVRRRCATVRTFHGSALRESQHATTAKRRIAYRLLHHAERLARRLATVSAALDADTQAVLRTEVVASGGVDVDQWRPGPKATTPMVLFVGTWSGRKRGHLVYDAFVRTVVPGCPDATLVMVCDVPPPPHPAVRHLAAPDDDTLGALYRQAWVVAYPSTYEGFGLVYLEAMASGTAVVATPSDAAVRFLADGAGVLAADDEFASALLTVLGDAALRARLEQRGRAVAESHSWTAVAARHRELYAEAASAHARRRRRARWPRR